MNIFISGSSRGIGKAVAERFLKDGHRVVGFDILKSSIQHPDYEHHLVDVADKFSFPQIACSANIVISNAGVQNSGKDIEVNLKGSIYFVEKYAFQPSIQSVLLVSSASAHSGAEFPEYSASKGGVNSFTKALAKELAPSNVTVNAIACGVIDTRMNSCFDAEERAALEKDIPMGRYGEPQEVAALAWQLASAPTYLTGQILTIDGGWQ